MTLSLRVSPASVPKRGIRLAALRVPLGSKVIGANLLVVALLFSAWLMAGGPVNRFVVAIALVALGLHVVMILVALRPIRDLELVASRVWHGDYGARVERSSVADHEVLRVGSMFNILLEGLASDRTRMRRLARDVIEAGERERAALGRELQESTAQHIAALLLELSSAARDAHDPEITERLGRARDAAESVLEEVRVLSLTVHPAVLDDLGLVPALQRLARDSSNGNGIDIDVNTDAPARRLPSSIETVLYRVAQEAVRNATRHAAPRRVRITLHAGERSATIDVHDDGRGFDLAEGGSTHSVSRGLESMRERVALVDGLLEIKTARGSGTTISATVPVDGAPDNVDQGMI